MSEWIIICYRTCLTYLILIISMRIMGKREIGQLSLFDLVILLTIVDVMVIGIENFQENFFYALVPIAIITFLQKISAFLTLRIPKLRTIIDGESQIVVKNSRLQIKTMKKNAYNVDDLLLQLRQQNIRSLLCVEYAILETSGKLSVFLNKSEDDSHTFPLPIISSGLINEYSLKMLKKNQTWLKEEMARLKMNPIHQIYCLMYDGNQLIEIGFDDY